MFILSATALDPRALQAAMAQPAAGAFVAFEGWVRDHNEGRRVSALDYEAFPELAEREGAAILTEVAAREDVLAVRCVHRTGHLRIGDLAVWVGVTARHRDAAFRACRAVIDAVKARVPIWKKEHYADGAAEWVNCAECARHAQAQAAEARPRGPDHRIPITEDAYYRRQMILPEVGEAGQARLRAARVLVVGAGGLGCPALRYLAAAGIGHLDVCDHDRVDASNLHRQVLFDVADVGRLKADVAAEKLRAQNPFITVTTSPRRCDVSNADERMGAFDIVLDCTDNFTTKFVIHDACHRAGVPLVQASIHQFEGQLAVYRPGAGGGCLRCLWPDALEDGCVGTCTEAGVLGVVPGVLGTLQAAECVKLLLGLPGVADRTLLLVDLLTHAVHRIARPRDPRCPLCGGAAAVPAAAPAPAVPVANDDVLDAGALTPAVLAGLRVIDIRTADERRGNPHWVQRLTHIPFGDDAAFAALDPGVQYLLVCAAGSRARAQVRRLRAAGRPNFRALKQGIASLDALLG